MLLGMASCETVKRTPTDCDIIVTLELVLGSSDASETPSVSRHPQHTAVRLRC